MTAVRIEPHYLPSIEFFVVLFQADGIYFDDDFTYQKQTYRNRTVILGPQGLNTLVVPVHFSSQTKLKDTRIDYAQSWLRDHWGAFYSCYGKAPFYDHFEGLFKQVWEKKPNFLIDLNMEMLSVCFQLLQWQNVTLLKKPKSDALDLRDHILPKKSFSERNIYEPKPYQQIFGNRFVPNLGILDLLLCQGPEASSIIRNSIARPIERFAL